MSIGQNEIILRNRFTNKGTAFTNEERAKYGLTAWFPYKVETMEEQISRCEAQFDELSGNTLAQWIYLTSIQQSNERLFYGLVLKNISKMLPIVYTPTVGAACTQYSEIWKDTPRGFYFNRDHRGHIREILDTCVRDIKIIVVTDGTRILGLGDLGTGGHQICVGKLALYTVGAGFDPATTLPISLDFGCNADAVREQPHYLGRKELRNKDSVYYEMVEELILAVKSKWPTCVFQFEDFSNDTCFDLLEKHRNHGLAVFNDDITGTGCVAAGAMLSALRSYTGMKARELTIVMYGAGAGGIGVAERIASLMVEEGATWEEAYSRFFIVDSQGLITQDREDYRNKKMQAHKLPWARVHEKFADYGDLLDVIKKVKPQVLLGLSTIGGSFNSEILAALAEGCQEHTPLVMALSNPTVKAECTPAQAIEGTGGRVMYCSGSPFAPVTYPNGVTIQTSQCNNFYVFPAIGLGSSVCEASAITDSMISAVSHGLAELVDIEDIKKGVLLPPIDDIRSITAHCALRLIRAAEKEGVARKAMPSDDAELLKIIREAQWVPHY